MIPPRYSPGDGFLPAILALILIGIIIFHAKSQEKKGRQRGSSVKSIQNISGMPPELLEKEMKSSNPSQRIRVNMTRDGTEIIISNKQNPLFSVVGFVSIFWFLGMAYSFSDMFSTRLPEDPFSAYFFPGLLFLIGLLLLLLWLSNLVGKERIGIKKGNLWIRNQIFGLGVTWNFDLKHVSGLFITHNGVSFEYKGETYSIPSIFGIDNELNEDEARFVFQELQKHHDFTKAT